MHVARILKIHKCIFACLFFQVGYIYYIQCNRFIIWGLLIVYINCTLVGRTCRAIKEILERDSKPVYDGIYTIQPKDGTRLKAYCDMKRDGGGWTLIVSSHTNSWTSDNVKLRNIDKPNLKEDYSILSYANDLKNNYLIKSKKFQYRLEANTMGEYWYNTNCLLFCTAKYKPGVDNSDGVCKVCILIEALYFEVRVTNS